MPDTRMDFARKLLADDPNLSDDDLSAALKIYDAHVQVGPEKARTWMDTAKDVGIGVAKGAGSTVAGLGEMAGNAGLLPSVRPNAFGDSAMRNPAFAQAEQATTATNTPQMIGKGLEAAAELALPVGAGAKAAAEAIPSAARAGAQFQSVMGAARAIPLNVEAPGQVALRIQQLAERGGGSMPRPVSQFLQRITNPEKAPLDYEEARDFASGISRLSANEFQRMGPSVAREVAELRVTLNRSVAEAANKAGKGKEYAQAMNEYAKAKKLSGMIDDAVAGAKSALPKAIGGGAAGAGAGAGWWLSKEIMSLLGGS